MPTSNAPGRFEAAGRKARPGDAPRFGNLLRNWLHQAISYMDVGELTVRIIMETVEITAVTVIMKSLGMGLYSAVAASFVVVHTWNWATNGLFWAVIIFAFPSIKNPGATETVDYLRSLGKRMRRSDCISGVALYGSISRGCWHDRSDIDIRLLRRRGLGSLLCAALITMKERFHAFLHRQPMDLYLADDVDFLLKLRSDEVPVILLDRDGRLESMYPGCSVQVINQTHFQAAE